MLGDYIIQRDRFNRENAGEVVQLLATQFVYETAEGHVRHCMFREKLGPYQRAKYEQSRMATAKARRKRKETKKIVAGLKKRLYRDLKH